MLGNTTKSAYHITIHALSYAMHWDSVCGDFQLDFIYCYISSRSQVYTVPEPKESITLFILIKMAYHTHILASTTYLNRTELLTKRRTRVFITLKERIDMEEKETRVVEDDEDVEEEPTTLSEDKIV